MRYQSKKDATIYAKLASKDEKFGTVILVYETGESVGKSISVTTSTLKRWWKKLDDSPVPAVNIDVDKLTEPFPEPKEKKYVPKPQSVIDYENSKKRIKCDLPEFEDLADVFGSICKKINESSKYVKLNDETTMWRKASFLAVYASETTWTRLTEAGFTSKANKDKIRPFAFTIKTMEEYERLKKALL